MTNAKVGRAEVADRLPLSSMPEARMTQTQTANAAITAMNQTRRLREESDLDMRIQPTRLHTPPMLTSVMHRHASQHATN